MQEKTKLFRIVKAKSDRFTVDTGEGRVVCYSRKKNKKDDLLVGDFVAVSGLDSRGGIDADCGKNQLVIESVAPRKNRLIRPAIANIDQILLLVCPAPRPDFYLLDKIIVNCLKSNIDLVLCINKCDLGADGLLAELKKQYYMHQTVVISALSGQGLEPLEQLMRGRLTCLAGQSAVGKSTLVSALTGLSLRTDGLSAGRGKNTTTATELYPVFGGLLADTPGFNMLDIHSVEHDELGLYYPEFEGVRDGCKYRGCSHTTEPDCAVRLAVEKGEIDQNRYKRYVEIFGQLKDIYDKKY